MPYQYVREPLTAEEADRLAAACETPTERLIVWTLLDTGVRVSDPAGPAVDRSGPRRLRQEGCALANQDGLVGHVGDVPDAEGQNPAALRALCDSLNDERGKGG
jgi:hypothetical protein